MSKGAFEISHLKGLTFENFKHNVRETENILCKVQDTLIQFENEKEELDVALKNIEKSIPKWLHPEIKKIVRRGVTRIRMNPNIESSIMMLQYMIDSCEDNLRKLECDYIEENEDEFEVRL